MLDFYAFLWPWLVACLAVGAATGALAEGKPVRKRPARWLIWAGLAALAAALSGALGAAQGAVSIHVESALACFVSFIVGCVLGAYAFRRSFAAHEGWAIGLIPAALLWLGAAHVAQPAYEAALQKRVTALAQAAGVDASGVALSGRDVIATPFVAQNKDLLSQIAAAPGVRRIVEPPAPRREQAEPAPKPADVRPDATATIPPPSPPAAPSEPGAVLATLPVGDLDAATCQRALDAVAAAEPVAFRASRATVNRRVALALDKAAEIIRRCPDVTIEVRGHGDEGLADTLSQRRASAAERYLRREGVAGRRLLAVGCCAQKERRAGAIDYIVR